MHCCNVLAEIQSWLRKQKFMTVSVGHLQIKNDLEKMIDMDVWWVLDHPLYLVVLKELIKVIEIIMIVSFCITSTI